MDDTVGISCQHGQLARVCELCEAEAEIAGLLARVAELEAERDAHQRAAQWCDKHTPGPGTRAVCLVCACQKLSAALSRISYACGEPNENECSDYDVHADEDAVVEQVRARVAELEAREPRRPDLLEKLTYHALERDDLTMEECLAYLAEGWRTVHGRTERQMVMQLLHLMAGGYPSAREAALEAERDARKGSPSERLHNICDGLAEAADESPFSREEWDRLDAEVVRLTAENADLRERLSRERTDGHVARGLARWAEAGGEG